MSRLFSDEELASLARSPRVVLEEQLAQGLHDDVEDTIRTLEGSFHAQLDRYTGWLADITQYLFEAHGPGALRALVGVTRAFVAVSPDVPELGLLDPPSEATSITAAARSGDPAGAMERFDTMENAWRRSIDFHRDWISALLTHVYREHGSDELEAVLRYSGDRGLMQALESDIARPVAERLVDFVRLLHGHFAELSLSEDSDKIVIVQDPCGTCSRQVLDGRYEPPLELGVVEEPHAVSWGVGSTTIYRSHIPIWHVVMARERIGVPWPVNQCPQGVDGGPCRILLYKDPHDPAANRAVPGSV